MAAFGLAFARACLSGPVFPTVIAAALRGSTDPGRRRAVRVQQGFTLLEVLVVMLIIGIVVGLASLSLQRPDMRVEEEARRLAALIDLAENEAVLQGREMAIELSHDGYRFLAYNGSAWSPLADGERVLRPRQLPDDLTLSVEIEGEQVTLGKDSTKGQGAAQARIYLLSSGEVTPFRLVLRRRDSDEAYRVIGDPHGRLAVKKGARDAA